MRKVIHSFTHRLITKYQNYWTYEDEIWHRVDQTSAKKGFMKELGNSPRKEVIKQGMEVSKKKLIRQVYKLETWHEYCLK